MQLATSSTLPTDPNLLALLFCGANPTVATPEQALGGPEATGFEALLSGEPPVAQRGVAPAMAAPVDLRGGVPFAFWPAEVAGEAEIPNEANGARTGLPVVTEGVLAPATATALRGPRPTPDFPVAALGAESPVEPTGLKKDSAALPRVISPRGPRAASVELVEVTELSNDESPAKPTTDITPTACAGWLPVPAQLPTEKTPAPTQEEVPAETAATNGDEPVAQRRVQPVQDSPVAQSARRLAQVQGPGMTAESVIEQVEPEPTLPARVTSKGHLESRDDGSREQTRAATLPEPEAPPPAAAVEIKFGVPLRAPRPSSTPAPLPQPSDPAEVLRVAVEPAAGLSAVESLPTVGAEVRREKIAAAPLETADRENDIPGLPEKTFVAHEGEVFAQRRRTVGTEVAKSALTMPAANTSPSAPLPASASAIVVAPTDALVERVESHNVLALALDGVRTAHEAVEVVLRTADRLSSLTHKSVRLEFSVGEEKLGVRVELRANEVRTTFHTESAELRGALAAEWQSVSASTGAGDRTLRILPAQFDATDRNPANAFSGDASSRHREPHAQPQPDAAPAFSFSMRGRASRTTSDARTIDSAFAAPGTALHLHTLA